MWVILILISILVGMCGIVLAGPAHRPARIPPGRSTFAVPPAYYYSGDGTWQPAVMTGATASASGRAGHVPPPSAGSHNSYLRGDGTWQFANNAPTAGQYYMTIQPDGITVAPAQLFPFALAPQASAGAAITQPASTRFRLDAGYVYKVTAAAVFADTTTTTATTTTTTTNTTTTTTNTTDTNNTAGVSGYCWYNHTTATRFGIAGESSATASSAAIGYIAPTAPTQISLIILYGGGTVQTAPHPRSFALLESVSNNNTVSVFAGATALAAGQQGYIPAPPAGSQSLFLRGDGTWAGGYANAPTAAQYYMASQPDAADVVAGQPFAFSAVPLYAAGSAVTQTTPAAFVLRGGHTYKLAAAVMAAASVVYRWHNRTAETAIGHAGRAYSTALGFLTPAADTTVQLMVVAADAGARCFAAEAGQCSWALIEVVGNSNTVAPFAGATADAAGLAGYIPAPPPGKHTAYLRGDGTWHTHVDARLHATMVPGVCVLAWTDYVPFANVAARTGTAITNVSPTLYSLEAGHTYACTASCAMLSAGLELLYVWYNISAQTQFGNIGQSTYNDVLTPVPARGIIAPTATTLVAVMVVSTSKATITCSGPTAAVPHMSIELL